MGSQPFRKGGSFVIAAVAATALVSLIANPVSAQYIIQGTTYNTTGSTENMVAVFTKPDGGISTNTYYGFVLVDVNGTGIAGGTNPNDAFYYSNDNWATHTSVGSNYMMDFDSKTLSAVANARDAKNFVMYDVSTNTEITSRPYVPAYNSANNHKYTVILDTALLQANATNLHFGVNDGTYTDNSGQYNLSITQLSSGTSSSVPEPSPVALMSGLLAAGSVFTIRKRKRF